MNYRNFRLISALGLGLAAFAAHAEEPVPAYSAKSIFFSENGDAKAIATINSQPLAKNENKAVVIATTPKQAKAVKVVAKKDKNSSSIGAAYFIRIKKTDGNSEGVLASRVFATGDKFQLGLKVNNPSYVYIFNEDANGQITMLHPQQGRSAAVDAMGTVFLPSQGSFQFEGPAGMEKLLVLMSQEEVFQPTATLKKIQPDLVTRAVFPAATTSGASLQAALVPASSCSVEAKDDAPAAASGAPVMLADAGTTAYASKAIVFAQDADNCVPTASAPAPVPAYASKAIVFADDSQPTAGQQVASYVVKPQTVAAKEPLFLKIQLLHR